MIESKNEASKNLEKALQALEKAKQRVAFRCGEMNLSITAMSQMTNRKNVVKIGISAGETNIPEKIKMVYRHKRC